MTVSSVSSEQSSPGRPGLSPNTISGLLQAEARLAAKRAARAEAREIRMKELERQQKEVTPGPSRSSSRGGSRRSPHRHLSL